MNPSQGVLANNWVYFLSHHVVTVGWVFIGLSLLVMLGQMSALSLLNGFWGPVTFSLLAMIVLSIQLLDSMKVALVILACVVWQLLMLVSLLAWFEVPFGSHSALAWVVVETLMVSNLVHLMTTLFREMARGSFQQEALSDALSLNISPIFLSNLSTALGFIVAAWHFDALGPMAWVVSLGALLSFVAVWLLLPIILLKWRLEFRVGNAIDRRGMQHWVDWLHNHLFMQKVILLCTLVVLGLAIYSLRGIAADVNALLIMLAMSFAILWAAWKSLSVVAMHLVATVFSLVLVLAVSILVLNLAQENLDFMQKAEYITMLFLLPFGIILDDGIHFFARFLKSKQTGLHDGVSAIHYAMASVGRAIWLTTWLLTAALLVLALLSDFEVQLASMLIVVSSWLATYITILVVPMLYLSRMKQ